LVFIVTHPVIYTSKYATLDTSASEIVMTTNDLMQMHAQALYVHNEQSRMICG
jgi:hypothetical protein